MPRRKLLNLTLFLSAAALGALLWLTGPEPDKPPQPLVDIAPEDVTRIVLERPAQDGAQRLVLEREAGQGRLAAPVTARADAAQVQGLLRLTRIVPERRYAASEIDLASAGLKPPLARLRFNEQPPVAIGGRGALGGARYLQIGERVLIANLPALGALAMPWYEWLDPALVAAGADLAQLRLPEITLTQAETGGWRVAPAERDRGADVAQQTIDTWRRARAIGIMPSTASDAPPVASVELVYADGRTRELGVIARSPMLVLRDPRLGVDYHLAANKAAPLLDMQHPTAARTRGAAMPDRSGIPLLPNKNEPAGR